MKPKFFAASCAIVFIAGCDSPTPPSITAAEFQAAETEFNRINNLSTAGTLPTGTVTYKGYYGGRVTGDEFGTVLGDMEMIVDFGTHQIGGSVSNINFVDDTDTPTQLLGGSLTISGTQSNGNLSGTATGTLSAVGEESVRGSASVSSSFSGTVRDDKGVGDAIAGTATGSASGDFDLSFGSAGFAGTKSP